MGQEIGITPLQLVALISTMANDGVYVAPRIVAATTQPQSTPQTIAFRPTGERRVISSLTAAQMRQMMQGVVLHGTGKRALLLGYSSAGKTGTAQKVDPATRAYSHTKYVATFAGFAPVNDPAVVVAVILDSAVGLHQGGQVSAPVFQRITQQVLEYMHTPHDVEFTPKQQMMLASRKVKDQDLEEGSPDRLGETLDVAEAGADTPPVPNFKPEVSGNAPGSPAAMVPGVVQAAVRQPVVDAKADNGGVTDSDPHSTSAHSSGTVVLDAEQ